MKILKPIFVLCFLFVTTYSVKTFTNKKIKQNENIINKNNTLKKPDRKLFFSPYLNSFEDYSAKKVGNFKADLDSQDYLGATPVGSLTKNMSSIIPGGFSGGFTMPGSGMFPMGHLGDTNNIQTTSLYNPLGSNPILQGGNASLAMGQGSVYQGRPLNGTSVTQFPMGTQIQGTNQNGDDQDQQMQQVTPRLYSPPKIQVEETCESVKTQAVNIANKVLQQQFQEMSEFVTNFLSQSKYIIQMGELKLTRKLRGSLYKYMNRFSNLSLDDVNFAGVKNKLDLSEKQLLQTFKEINDQEDQLEKPKIDDFVSKI